MLSLSKYERGHHLALAYKKATVDPPSPGVPRILRDEVDPNGVYLSGSE